MKAVSLPYLHLRRRLLVTALCGHVMRTKRFVPLEKH